MKITTTQPNQQYYRQERKWDHKKQRIVVKEIPCSFQEMLESANAERERIKANDSMRKA